MTINDDGNKINNKTMTSQSFEYKTKIIQSMPNNNILHAEAVVPLRYLNTEYSFSWKSKGVYDSKRKPSYTAFWHSTKLYGYRTVIKFDKDALAVEQNNYLTKIVNIYIVNDLDAWPRNPTNNFKLKNCLYGATSIVKNSDKEKYLV